MYRSERRSATDPWTLDDGLYDYRPSKAESRGRPRARTLGRDEPVFREPIYENPRPPVDLPYRPYEPLEPRELQPRHNHRPKTMYEPTAPRGGYDLDDFPRDPYAPRSHSHAARSTRYPSPPPSYSRRYASPDPVPARRHSKRDEYYDYGEPRKARRGRYDDEPARHISRRDKPRDEPRRSRQDTQSLPRGRAQRPGHADDYYNSFQPPRRSPPGHRRHSRSRSRSGSRSRRHSSPSPKRGGRHKSLPSRIKEQGKTGITLAAVATTALRAGAKTAYKLRDHPSPWMGEKGIQVGTAALSAALVDTFIGKQYPKRRGGVRHLAMKHATNVAMKNIVSGAGGR